VENDPECDRTMVFYGFVRGTHLNPKMKVHLIGVGDYDMADISVLPDPCPLPDKERDRTTLSKKDALLFAPLSDVGAVTFDKDAVYIDIRQANYTKKENLAIISRRKEDDGDADNDEEEEEEVEYDSDAPAGMLKNLQDVRTSVDEKMKKSSFRIFKGSKAIVAEESSSYSEEESEDDDDDSESEGSDTDRRRSSRRGDALGDLNEDMESESDDENESDSGDEKDDEEEDEESSDDEIDEESEEEGTESSDDENLSEDEIEGTSLGVNHWKSSIAERAKQSFLERESGMINLQELVYGQSQKSSMINEALEDEDESSSDDDDEFFKPKVTGSRANNSLSGSNHVEALVLDEEDSCRMVEAPLNVTPWLEDSDGCLVESIRNKFVTGNWGKEEEEEYGDFEDLESGEKFTSSGRDATGSIDDLPPEGLTDEELRDFYAKKKAEQKSKFDDDYDNEKKQDGGDMNDESAENEYIEALKREKEARLARNKEEFGIDGERSRLRHEGFRQGLYCRVKIEGIPSGFVTGFDPKMPLVLGGLTTQETSLSLTRCRFKKHRWHKKILRSNDPLVFSIGWRRFQSIPVL
jgi:ribosome biogenesis protein BMS1